MKKTKIAETDKGTENKQAIRTYKDTVFRMLFREPEHLLELYNAVSGGHYTDPAQLQIVTLENAVYMNMKNDLAFLIDFRLNLYEHQGTVNPNMPYRFLQYVAKEYEKLSSDDSVYGRKRMKLPTPQFLVFYNGMEEQPEVGTLRLSDAFEKKDENPSLELIVKVLNINYGHNRELMEHCRTLKEYAQYVARVRKCKETMTLDEAVNRAVEECIEQGILKDFLRKNRSEVKSMSIFEYDEEKVKALWKRESFEEGLEQGRAEGKAEGRAEGRAEGMAEGRTEGRAEGMAEGKVEGITLAKTVFKLASRNFAPEEIAEQLEISVEKVLEILE